MLFTFSFYSQGRTLCKLLIFVKNWLFDAKRHNDYMNWQAAFQLAPGSAFL